MAAGRIILRLPLLLFSSVADLSVDKMAVEFFTFFPFREFSNLDN